MVISFISFIERKGNCHSMFKSNMLERILKDATETTVEIFEKAGPFKTKNSDIPMEIDFSNVEFRNEVHINEDGEIYIGQYLVGTNIKQGRGIMLTASKDLQRKSIFYNFI